MRGRELRSSQPNPNQGGRERTGVRDKQSGNSNWFALTTAPGILAKLVLPKTTGE